MKKIITGLFAIAAFTFSASAQDQTDGQNKMNKERQGMHKGHDGMRGMEQLNLTDAQKQQMRSINEEFRTRMQTLHQNDNILVKDQKAQTKALMEERKNKISAILTSEQKTKFEQLHKQGGKDGRFAGSREDGDGRGRGGGRISKMKTELGLTDDQVAKIKAGSESFKQRAEAIRNDQSLTQDQKKTQFEALQKERQESFKSYLTTEQIAKLDAAKRNGGDWKNKSKGEDWKQKRKSEDGKEKIKIKTT